MRICPTFFAPFLVSPDLVCIFFDIGKDLKGSDKLKFIKTFPNAWVTSYRLHEDTLLNCLFGCQGQPDSLEHYLQCSHLSSLMRFLVAGTSRFPLIRWGLQTPSKSALQTVCCTFSGYHACKSKVRMQQMSVNFDSWESLPLQTSWTTFAEAFRAEASELCLKTRSFSVPSFLNYLMQGSPEEATQFLANSASAGVANGPRPVPDLGLQAASHLFSTN